MSYPLFIENPIRRSWRIRNLRSIIKICSKFFIFLQDFCQGLLLWFTEVKNIWWHFLGRNPRIWHHGYVGPSEISGPSEQKVPLLIPFQISGYICVHVPDFTQEFENGKTSISMGMHSVILDVRQLMHCGCRSGWEIWVRFTSQMTLINRSRNGGKLTKIPLQRRISSSDCLQPHRFESGSPENTRGSCCQKYWGCCLKVRHHLLLRMSLEKSFPDISWQKTMWFKRRSRRSQLSISPGNYSANLPRFTPTSREKMKEPF